jgi:hypothetical protein
MFERIRSDFRAFLADPPGARFERRYEHRRRADAGIVGRRGWIGTGAFFVLAGIVMLFTPGPGLLSIGFGLTCLAQESLALARWCDRVEMRVREVVDRFRKR